jgi:hypothetical protein
LLAAAVNASVAQDQVPIVGNRLLRLCPEDARISSAAAMQNDDKRTVAELLGIVPRSIEILYSSTHDVETRVREILAARSRFLSPFINWSEGADLRSEGFIVNLQTARLEVAG